MGSPLLASHPRVVFFIAFTIGTLAIYSSGADLQRKLILTLAVMSFYALWVWNVLRADVHAEQYADSLYYLGFLLTLVSLSASVLPLLMGNVTDPKVDYILAHFGTGLVATVFGLAGKIFFSQFSVGSDRTLEKAQERAASALSHFASEVEYHCDYVKQLRSKLVDEMQTMVTVSNSNVSRVVEDCTRAVGAASEALSMQLQQTLASSQERMADSQGALAESIKAIDLEVVKLKESIEGQLALGEEQKRALKAFGSSIRTIGKQYSDLSKSAEVLNGIQSALSKVNEEFKNAALSLKGLSDELDAMKAVMEGHTTRGEQVVRVLGEQVEDIRRRRTELESEVREAEKTLQAVYRGLRDNTDYIINKLGG